MIQIYLNGEPKTIAADCSLAEFLNNSEQYHENSLYAVAVNGRVIARVDYSHTILHDEDVIDIVSPQPGG